MVPPNGTPLRQSEFQGECTMWIMFAFASALFAGVTSILAKCGIKQTDSTVATAVRTIVVLIFSWLMVLIEAAESMGSTTWQIIRKVLIPEAMPSLINGAAICMTTILAYTAMAGSAGGDGLGKIAITYGLNYREYDIMYVSSLLLVALVQIIQIAGGILMRAADHRKK